jgi:RNA polymerase sigma factor (sigma-70 family)
MTRSEATAIVEGVRRHDAAAEEALFAECWRWRKQGWPKNAETAEDLAQELFVRCWQAIMSGALRQGHALAVYIFQTRRNMGIDHHRRTVTRRGVTYPKLVALLPIVEHNPASHTDTPEECMLRTERMAAVTHATDTALTRSQRAIVAATLDGMEAPECARSLGISPNRVRVSKHRAITRLREALAA